VGELAPARSTRPRIWAATSARASPGRHSSYLQTSPEDRVYDDPLNGISSSFTGRSRLLALSGVLKWAPNGNTTGTNFKLQGEYFQRRKTAISRSTRRGRAHRWVREQAVGRYLQGVYQFMPQWRAGYRFVS
jgi:hypothetical protein